MAENLQQSVSQSNARAGRNFERTAQKVLERKGINVQPKFSVKVGVAGQKKLHSFDLGSDDPPIIVECKYHRWTGGNNVPSAKMSVWNEAMYYFQCAPKEFRKILFVLRDERQNTGETLAEYYLRTYHHLIPKGVEVWEYSNNDVTHRLYHPRATLGLSYCDVPCS